MTTSLRSGATRSWPPNCSRGWMKRSAVRFLWGFCSPLQLFARSLNVTESTIEPTGRSVIVPLRAGGSLPPIFAVPGVFGNVIGLADLARELGSEQPFYGLQSLGLDGGEAPVDSIEEIARTLCKRDSIGSGLAARTRLLERVLVQRWPMRWLVSFSPQERKWDSLDCWIRHPERENCR